MICSGDFSLYDHVLDHSVAFNVIPKRYLGLGLSDMDVYFAMGCGRQTPGVDVPACGMKKWCVFLSKIKKQNLKVSESSTRIIITSYPNFQKKPTSN